MSKIKTKETRVPAFKKKAALEVTEMVNAMPMIGWHNPYAEFNYNGEKWEVAIGGGVRALVITRPDNRKFVIDLTELVDLLIDDIKAVK